MEDLMDMIHDLEKNLLGFFENLANMFAEDQSLVVRGLISKQGCTAEVKIKASRNRVTVLDEPVSQEDFEKIRDLEGFKPKHLAIIELFQVSGNAPVTRRDVINRLTLIDQINGILRQNVFPYAICTPHYPGRRRNKYHYWTDPLCVRKVIR